MPLPLVVRFDPWGNVDKLPESAPVRSLRPDAYPGASVVRPRLGAAGIDPDDAGAIIGAMFRRGCGAWLICSPGPPRHFVCSVLEPRYGASWAHARGATPAEARGSAYVACDDAPPWELRPEDLVFPGEEGGE